MSRLFSSVRAWSAISAAGALIFASIAIASHGHASTKPVTATFAATSVPDRKTETCTGADGSYEITHAKYTGTSTSADRRLNGTIELHVTSVYNTTKNLGRLDAKVHVRSAAGADKAEGNLHAVNTRGQLQGLLSGSVHDPAARLLANVSAAFTSTGGFTSGQLGTGTAANTAIVYQSGCTKAKGPKPTKPAKLAKPGKH